MENQKIVNTDKVCNSAVEKFNYIYVNTNDDDDKLVINSIKEAKLIKLIHKKAGMPALVYIKKHALLNLSKKAGKHPIGNKKNHKVLLKIIITAAILMILSVLISKRFCRICPPSATPGEGETTPLPGMSSQIVTLYLSPAKSASTTSLVSWAYRSMSSNKLGRMINGNGRRGYNIGLWNCRRGLVRGEKLASTKMVEVKQFIENKRLHILCLVESDLHGTMSRYNRRHPLTTEDIHHNLEVPGYKIILPKSWQVHGQARVMVLAKEELQVKIKDIGTQNSDLPTISCEIGLGQEKKTIVNFFYREFTGGVSGLKDTQSQIERLSRQLKIWKTLCAGTKDVICMGDANLCALKWLDDSYEHKELSEMIQNFLLESACSQLVKEYTRSEFIQGGVVARSCIDHCYTNVPEKVSEPEVIAIGNSDHLGIVVRKFTRVERSKPNTVMKRSYKSFKVEDFLTDIMESNINRAVTAHAELDKAAEIFEEKFRTTLDKHAPIKVFQMRKNYAPYLSQETKLLMEERKVLKEEMTKALKQVT